MGKACVNGRVAQVDACRRVEKKHTRFKPQSENVRGGGGIMQVCRSPDTRAKVVSLEISPFPPPPHLKRTKGRPVRRGGEGSGGGVRTNPPPPPLTTKVRFFFFFFFVPVAKPRKGRWSVYVKPPRFSQRNGSNGTYSRYGFIVGEFPSPGLTAGRTDRPLVRPCIVFGRVGEEERLSSGEKTRIKAFLT